MGKLSVKFYIIVFIIGMVFLIIFFIAGFKNFFSFLQPPYPSQINRIQKSVREEPGGVIVTPFQTITITVSPNPEFPNGYNIP